MVLFVLGRGRMDQEKAEILFDVGAEKGFLEYDRLGGMQGREVVAAIDIVRSSRLTRSKRCLLPSTSGPTALCSRTLSLVFCRSSTSRFGRFLRP